MFWRWCVRSMGKMMGLDAEKRSRPKGFNMGDL